MVDDPEEGICNLFIIPLWPLLSFSFISVEGYRSRSVFELLCHRPTHPRSGALFAFVDFLYTKHGSTSIYKRCVVECALSPATFYIQYHLQVRFTVYLTGVEWDVFNYATDWLHAGSAVLPNSRHPQFIRWTEWVRQRG